MISWRQEHGIFVSVQNPKLAHSVCECPNALSQLLPSDAHVQFLCSEQFVVLHHIQSTNQNEIRKATLVYFVNYTLHFLIPQEVSMICWVNVQPRLLNGLSYWSSPNASKPMITCNYRWNIQNRNPSNPDDTAWTKNADWIILYITL